MTVVSPSFLLLLALPRFQLFLIALGGADPFLNKPLIREDIRDCMEYFKNTTMKVTHPHLWEAARAVLRGDSLLPGLTLRRERKRNNKSSPCLMNFVPFKLQTKRKEKKEVINLNKMEEERVDKLNQRHLEEMTFVQSGAVWDRDGEGRVLPFIYLEVDGFGGWGCCWPCGHLQVSDFRLEFLLQSIPQMDLGRGKMLKPRNEPQQAQHGWRRQRGAWGEW